MGVVDNIEHDLDRIKYPDRRAQIMRNSFELSQLDGLGLLEMGQQNDIIELKRQKTFSYSHLTLPTKIDDVISMSCSI